MFKLHTIFSRFVYIILQFFPGNPNCNWASIPPGLLAWLMTLRKKWIWIPVVVLVDSKIVLSSSRLIVGVQGLLSKLSTTHPDSLHGKNKVLSILPACWPVQMLCHPWAEQYWIKFDWKRMTNLNRLYLHLPELWETFALILLNNYYIIKFRTWEDGCSKSGRFYARDVKVV